MASSLDFFAGCLGGCAGIMVGYPLDTVKVHMQTQDCRNPKYRGTFDCLRTLLAKESVNGLYKGMTSPIAGVAVVNSIVFGVYGYTQRNLSEPDRLSSYFLAGASAGIAQTPVSSPIELAKTRLQLQSTGQSNFRGPMECLRSIYKHEGHRGVFKGLGITFLREGPSYGVYFVTYEMLTKTSSNQPISTLHMLLAGGLAGTASWVISYPIDVIKSRIQAESSNRYSGAFDCLKKSVRAEGYSCLYRGLNSTILRAFPTNAATFAVVTWTFRLFGEQSNEAPKTEDIVSRTPTQTKNRTAKRYESFVHKWNVSFDGISRSNGFVTPPYSVGSMLSISRLMLDNTVCQFHSCRRSGCKHDALKQENASESWEERKRKSRNDEGVEEDGHIDEKKDCSNVKMAIDTCTCKLQRVLGVSNLDNT
ncbi:PREDICTED: mitochondrial basic amino acids transporter-like [Vollenhovia emeryi]|uniref:mitochondrial basic amino acids transporter-like n=1 Tax=Vollenhovia emeryi TaxID=411798 RepID=UPI0005F4AD72|nr:PREDICTED: mitochondrial basic amino acids transporter-like [Vollenhovia emeryi]XP_011877386.1 PREDICTED: mitochondrial basic amino acids transporter-like [Vollenhovia emeryi]XP_011877387.1 PREDICTED: mitochondrial basic amino acids transporter-like [Vollenhovia emeryi]XP_011877388.1 PREDICTED: mitochondrial basic amino acids transporter-like [Vollenhovia emeryi]XP_011877389.1 PREDICTED: mitochondrial basic amino acids transporter-like [Vollenhovia emeryi]XP_011877390.1 PREDICTED: mitochond